MKDAAVTPNQLMEIEKAAISLIVACGGNCTEAVRAIREHGSDIRWSDFIDDYWEDEFGDEFYSKDEDEIEEDLK